MKKLNQKGFGAIEFLAIILLIVVVAGVGYFVYDKQKTKETSNTSPSTTNTSSQTETTTTSNDQYVEVPGQGVKIGFGPYVNKIKVSELYNIKGDASSVTFSAKPDYSPYVDCSRGLFMTRTTDASSAGEPNHKLGDYYYYLSGAGDCENEEASENTDTVDIVELSEQFESLGVKNL